MWESTSSYIIREAVLSVLVVAATPFFYAAWKLLQSFWLTPLRIKRAFEAQGIKCLPFLPPHGNVPELSALFKDARASPMPQLSHDIASRIQPYLYCWSKLYGDLFVYWFGPQARVILTHPDQAKEILSTKFGYYTKAGRRPDADDLAGGGLVTLEGEKWAQHRRIMTPAFFLEKLKAMAPTMAACTTAMMEQWENEVDKGEEIDAFDAFQNLTADIIARTAFGSSFAEGRQVFEMQHEQQVLIERILRTVYIPGSSYIPTALNRYRWKLNRNIVRMLRQLVEKRLQAVSSTTDVKGNITISNDLVGLMMAANAGQLQGSQKNLSMGMDDIINECKTFFFAGHETTSTLLTWTFLMLASNPEWQERAREEVQTICGSQELPSAESINQLKIVNMVLNETLRLYPPIVRLLRKAPRDLQLGKVVIPAGTVLEVPIIAWHHDKRFWGPDASEFRPERFEGGVGKASSVPHAFMPFSMGPRNCIGQTFAMLEAKVALSTILQRYRFRLSPNYRHAPTTVITLQPQLGMPLIFEKLSVN